MNHEPGRWSRVARPMDSARLVEAPPGASVMRPQQMHLVSQGYPVRIRRALLAGGLALALAVGGTLTASLTSGSAAPPSEQSDAIVTTPVGTGS